MRAFAALYAALERTTSTNAKIAALTTYFRETPPADAAWAVYFLSGRRLLRLLPSKLLRQWTLEEAWRGDELVPVARAYSGLRTTKSRRWTAGCVPTRSRSSGPCDA